MTVKEMHYDFKMKLNKIDSQQYKNLIVPEIDWLLNEAQELFVKLVAEPKVISFQGFEKSQRTIDDIKTLVVENKRLNVTNNIVTLPDDYMFFIKGHVLMSKGFCSNTKGRLIIRQHDDMFEESPFDKSSFEWREVNGVFNKDGIQLFDDGTFINNHLILSYIKYPNTIHNAEDFSPNGYKSLNGESLTGHSNCELPKHTHRDIVDIAVLIAGGQLQIPDYNIKSQKLQLNQVLS